MKNESIFLGFAIPDDVAKQAFMHDKNAAIQTHKFGWSFISALTQFTHPFLVSSMPVSNYPSNNKILFKGGRFTVRDYKGFYVPFINIVLLKHVSRFLTAFFILSYYILVHGFKNIYVHGVHSPYLILCYFFSLFGLKYYVILTDPAGVILPNDSKLSKILKKIDKKIIGYFVKNSNSVICLSPYLIDHYKVKSNNVVFPGILNDDFSKVVDANNLVLVEKKNNNTFKIIYAGGLHEAYGLKLLVDAVAGLNKSIPVQLFLYGMGDQVGYIKEKSLVDSRIQYMGFCGNEELVPALLGADLLVNPRPSHQEFATLSFPSKLIEYLYTGVPVLTTRIKSIPTDYQAHFFYIDDESVTGIQNAILDTIQLPKELRLEKAYKASLFVKKNASEEAIGERLRLMINEIPSKSEI